MTFGVGQGGQLGLFGLKNSPTLRLHPGRRSACGLVCLEGGRPAAASAERLICKMEMPVLTPFVIVSALMTVHGTVRRKDLGLTGKNQLKLTYPLEDFRAENTVFLDG